MAQNVLKNIPNSRAAMLLRAERARLTDERMTVARELNALQARLDKLDERLREVTDGERVLAERS